MNSTRPPDLRGLKIPPPCLSRQIIALCLSVIIYLAGGACRSSGSQSSISYQPSGTWIDGTHSLLERFHLLVEEWETALPAPELLDGHPELGDQRNFHAVDFARGGNPYSTSATCRAVGEFCYIFVEDEQWQNGSVKHTDVVKLRRAFDEVTPADPSRGIYEIEVQNLGPPPDDIDQDPKIYILLLDIPDRYEIFGTYVAGYFEPVNQKRGVIRDPNTGLKFYSNEVEMIYIDSNPLKAGGELSKEILAHEFQHLIHWRHDPNEDIWLNEGCSDYAAMFLCGYNKDFSMHIEAFEDEPGTSLVYWPAGEGSSLANYGAAYLWMVYLHEHYGGVSTISSLVANPANGINGINTVLSASGYSDSFEDVFADWKLANFLDNTDFSAGKYGYRELDLKVRNVAEHSSFPVSKKYRDIQSWAADYIEFTGGDGLSDLQIDFTVSNPSYSFDVRVIEMDNGMPVGVKNMQFQGGANSGYISIPRFGYAVDKVILVPNWKPKAWADFDDIIPYLYSARLGKNAEFRAVVLPNAIHEGYIDIIFQIDEDIDANAPSITITKLGETLVDDQSMKSIAMSGSKPDMKSSYVYQMYIPHDWDLSEIRWNISYLGRWLTGGDLGSI